MPAGRPPKPTYLKILEGNPGKRPLNANEPKPAARQRIPTPPKSLGDIGKKEWRRLAKDLVSKGVMTDWDLSAFHAYCYAYERFREAEAKLAQYGDIITTPNGMLQQSPYIGMANRALDQMNRFLGKFGLSPSDRTKIQVNTQASDPVADRLFRKRAL